MTSTDAADVSRVIAGLDRWFDAMRVDWSTPGYGGVVVHWWNDSLAYKGSGLDWRYEGIIDGYLTLYRKFGDPVWLEKAVRAGQDLVSGQLPNGNFKNSGFERNPETGGTPHEAACDIALLLLARELRTYDADLSQHFLLAAQRNLEAYWFGELWNVASGTLWDRPGVPSFVPNKAATFIEATLLLSELANDEGLITRYVLPTGERILQMQVRRPKHWLDGAIAQNWLHGKVNRAYFPVYIARCIPPLLRLTEVTAEPRFREGAMAAAQFLCRVREQDGGFPQVLYGNGRMNRYPRWVAGAGDIVRALWHTRTFGLEGEHHATIHWLLKGARSDGRVVAAEGFGKVIPLLSRRNRFADELGVVGWADKAFRALALAADYPDPRRQDSSGLSDKVVERVVR